MLRAQLAACMLYKQLARIEPMLCFELGQHMHRRPFKLWILGTTVMPKRPTVRRFVQAQHLLDATIAVGVDEDVRAGKRWLRVGHMKEQIVVELPLKPMRQQCIRAKGLLEEHQGLSKNNGLGDAFN